MVIVLHSRIETLGLRAVYQVIVDGDPNLVPWQPECRPLVQFVYQVSILCHLVAQVCPVLEIAAVQK